MSYADVLASQSKEVLAFARITRKKTYLNNASGGDPDFIVDGDGRFYFDWPYGTTAVGVIGGRADNGSALAETFIFTEVFTRAGVDAGPSLFFFDAAAERVYVSDSAAQAEGGSTSIGNISFSIEYESFYASQEIGFYQDPTDDSTPMKKWVGGLKSIPTVRRSASDSYSGFAPSEISPLEIFHEGVDLWTSLYEESFYQCRCDVWICVGAIRTENVEKVFTGNIKGVTGDDLKLVFELVENYQLLNGSFDGRYYQPELFNKLDTYDQGKPIPIAFGSPAWIKCVNVDHISESPTTSDNRRWAVYDLNGLGYSQFTLGTLSGFDGSSYQANQTAAVISKLTQGARLRRVSDGQLFSVLEPVLTTSFRISGTGSPVAGDVLVIQPVIEVFMQVPSKQGFTWTQVIGGTVSCGELNGVVTVDLTSGFEAAATSLAITTIDPSDFEVWAHVIGSPRDLQYNSGILDSTLGSANEVTALYWYLTQIMGIDEEFIDGAAFQAAIALRPIIFNREENIATFVHPIWSSNFEDHKTVIGRLLQQSGLIGYFNRLGQFTVIARDVLGTADYVLTDAEILTEPKYEIASDDVRGFRVDAGSSVIGVKNEIVKIKPSTVSATILFANGPIGNVKTTRRAMARGIMRVDSVQLYDVCRQTKDATTTADYMGHTGARRMAIYFSDRRLAVRFRASGPVLDAVPGNTIEIDREYLPGYDFIPGTDRTRKFIVLDCERDGGSIELLLEDQYSIEQNGDF